MKKAMDISAELGANKMNLWTGQDGYDYPLQTDYLKNWSMMIEVIWWRNFVYRMLKIS